MMDPQSKMVRMFKALGNPNRLRLFLEIRGSHAASYEEQHVCFLHNIMEKLNVGAPTVSHHLKELVNAELIITEKQGKFLTCRVNEDATRVLEAFFRSGQLQPAGDALAAPAE
jgi:ArsR family transcriptional regulator